MALTLFFSVPFSYYLLKKKEQELHYLHPGQAALKTIALVEALMFGVCFVIYVVSGTNVGGYMMQNTIILSFYIALHLCFLLIHNAMGKRDEFEGTDKHIGITLRSFIGMAVLMLLFLIFLITILAI